MRDIDSKSKLDDNETISNVTRNDNTIKEILKIKRKDIICPICKEKCFITFRDYKINLNCEQKHYTNNILLKDYDETQKNRKTIICSKCNKNKSTQFYKCIECQNIYCQNCKDQHTINHKLIEVEIINYNCLRHNSEFTFYCKDCEINICEKCKSTHQNNHSFISLNDMNNNINIEKLKEEINKMKDAINNIITMLKEIIESIDIYFEINKKIDDNYNKNNYIFLQNVENINNFNEKVINDIEAILRNDKVDIKFKKLTKMYERMMNINLDRSRNLHNQNNIDNHSSSEQVSQLISSNSNNNEIKIELKFKKNYNNDEIKIFGEKFVEKNNRIYMCLSDINENDDNNNIIIYNNNNNNNYS